MKMNKLLAFFIIVSVFSCKTGDSTPDWTGDYLGVYRTEASFGDKYSKYTWTISKEGHNQLRIGFLTVDAYAIGSGTLSIRNFYSVKARLIDQKTLEIDESVKVEGKTINVQTTGVKNEQGWIAIKLPSIGIPGETEYLEFKRDSRISAPISNSMAGTYKTTTVEKNQTTNHTMIVSKKEGNILKIDYTIEDLVTIGGNVLRAVSEYSLQNVTLGENNSIKINEVTGNGANRMNITASGILLNFKYSESDIRDVIAMGIQYTFPNGTEARKPDYLEFRKQ